MRSMVMSFSVLVMLFSQDLFASAKTDSIVAFLGGSQAKFVWMKWAWCNENYQPKQEAAAKAEGWSMQLLDTREGTQRTLTTGLGTQRNLTTSLVDANFFRISRSGKWATFIMDTSTYIVDLTAASPTRKVLMSKSDCRYWCVEAWWVDPANGTEYVYCLDSARFDPFNSTGGGYGIYKVKVNGDGTVDRSTATKLTINGLQTGGAEPPVEVSLSVSADGKKIAGAFPWPDTKILDVATGRLDVRHVSGFGCQANLAPDNSYRFFHCQSDHLGIEMFDANMSTTNWFVDLRKNLAGLLHPEQTGEGLSDFLRPRWTNHLQYYCFTAPMGYYGVGNSFNQMDWQYMDAPDGSSLWTKDSTWVKTQWPQYMDGVIKVYLAKFSPDFKTQEKSILIGYDPRYFQCYIDGWICNGTTYGSQCTGTSASLAIRGDRLRGLSVVQSGAFVNLHTDAAATVRIIDARGRIVRMWRGTGDSGLDTRALATGTYLVSVTTGQRSASIRLPVTGSSR